MSATPHAAAHIYNKFDFTKPCQKCSMNNERIAKRIDHCGLFDFFFERDETYKLKKSKKVDFKFFKKQLKHICK